MSALDAFGLTPAEWEAIELSYEEVDGMSAEDMLVTLLQNTTKEQQKWLALGIMVGRASMGRT